MSSLAKVNAAKVILRQQKMWSIMPTRCAATMKFLKPDDHKIRNVEFFDKNDNLLKRPLSPHLTIYQYQITNMLSITHRFTGVINAGYIYAIAAGAVWLPGTYPEYLELLQSLPLAAPLILAAKFCLAWPVGYHIGNGVRHLAWDMGYGFQMPDLYKTGYCVVAFSLAFAALMASL